MEDELRIIYIYYMRYIFLLTLLFLFVGCTNPTVVHSLQEEPNDFTISTYRTAVSTPMMESENELVFERNVAGGSILFRSESFCYDSVANSVWFPGYYFKDSVEYFAVPRDSILVCKSNSIKNNSTFSRNRMIFWPVTMAASFAGYAFPLLAFWSLVFNTFIKDFLVIEGTLAGVGAVVGLGVGGISSLAHNEVESPYEEKCSSYFQPVAEQKFLQRNKCKYHAEGVPLQ